MPYANVLDVRIGHPTIINTTITPGVSSGELFVRSRHSTRRIEVDIELPLDQETYPENVRAIKAWAHSEQPKRMTVSAYKSRYIMAICSNINTFSLRDWWLPITLQFDCFDAYFVSVHPNEAPIGSAFTISGDEEPIVTVTHQLGSSGSLSAPVWQFDGNQQIKLKPGTVVTGGSLEIDLAKQSVSHGDVSLMDKVTLNSRFPHLAPGNHIITGPSGGVISWHERWL